MFGWNRKIFVYEILGNKKVFRNVLNNFYGILESIEFCCYWIIVLLCDVRVG